MALFKFSFGEAFNSAQALCGLYAEEKCTHKGLHCRMLLLLAALRPLLQARCKVTPSGARQDKSPFVCHHFQRLLHHLPRGQASCLCRAAGCGLGDRSPDPATLQLSSASPHSPADACFFPDYDQYVLSPKAWQVSQTPRHQLFASMQMRSSYNLHDMSHQQSCPNKSHPLSVKYGLVAVSSGELFHASSLMLAWSIVRAVLN